ncbi:MAG: hypothetical protein KDJ76_00610 [Xanthobacteraceae bacterium]|nr:hypothetical protein [Xanthobacteraceae bacterium]
MSDYATPAAGIVAGCGADPAGRITTPKHVGSNAVIRIPVVETRYPATPSGLWLDVMRRAGLRLPGARQSQSGRDRRDGQGMTEWKHMRTT